MDQPADTISVAAVDEAAPPYRQRRYEKVSAWQDAVTRHEEGEEDSAWLITYLDMLTLLLSLLVVMLSYSTFNEKKFTEVTTAPPSAAQSSNPNQNLPAASLQVPVAAPTSTTNTPATASTPTATDKPTTVDKATSQADDRTEAAKQLAQRLAAQLIESGLQDMVKMDVKDSRLTLQIQEKILFPSGGTDLNQQGAQVLDRLAPLLMAPEQKIAVEGHTDNVPIKTQQFPSNWELSAARASRVVRYLAERGVPAKRLRAIGYAEMQPIASNVSEQGRSVNRRVAIVIDLAPVKPELSE